MRVYHRLIHIRDQKERHEDIPNHITAHPVFKLTTDFRRHVQQKSAPISKTSPLVVDAEAMAIFGRLAAVLGEQGSVVMIYLVACILERLFGKETVEDIEAIRGELTLSDIIDGISTDVKADDREMDEMEADDWREEAVELQQVSHPAPPKESSNGWLSSSFTPQSSHSTAPPIAPPTAPPTAPPVATSAFAGLVSTPNVFGTPSIFGGSVFSNLNQPLTTSVFDTQPPQTSFGDLSVSNSNSVSILPTPVAAINSTPFAIPEEPDIINGISTDNEADDTEVDETDELELDDWQEDATEPQQVPSPTQLKPTSDVWLSSSFFTSQPSTAPAPTALPPVTPAFTGFVSPPMVDKADATEAEDWHEDATEPQQVPPPTQLKPSLDGWFPSSFTSQPSTAPAPTAPPEATATSTVLIPTPVVDEVVDEVDATEADVSHEDPTELQQASLLTPFKPSSNGWASSSFTSQPSTSTTTTPILTPVPVATSDISVPRKRVRRRISSQYHPPRTDEELAKRFKEVQSVLVACFSTTFNGPDGFSFFPSWHSFDAYICIFSRNMKNTSFVGLKDPSFKSYENTSKCAVRPR